MIGESMEVIPEIPCDKIEGLELGSFLLNRIEAARDVEPKNKKAGVIFDQVLAARAPGQNLYPLIRLLLPGKDNKRSGKYQVGEKKLAKVFADVLGINTTESRDGRILSYFMGKAAARGKCEFSKLGDAIEVVVRKRFQTYESKTIGDVNNFLDEVVKANGKEKALREIFNQALQDYSARELRFITMIICGDLQIGFGVGSIMERMHRSAYEKFRLCGQDLAITCAVVASWIIQGKAQVILSTAFTPGQPFQPMLCQGFSNNGEKSESLEDKLCTVEETQSKFPIIIEEKIDGWRMIIHKIDRDTYKMFTRNYTEYDDFTVPEMITALNILTRDYDACILDGEMIAIDARTGQYLPFGTVLSCAKKEKLQHSEINSSIPHELQHSQLQYVLFDVLNTSKDPNLSTRPLSERRRIMDAMLQNLSSCNQLQKRIATPAHKIIEQSCVGPPRRRIIFEFFHKILSEKGEGVVIKQLDSEYVRGRSKIAYWCKVKPEDGSVHCDMVIVGAYWSKGYGRQGLFHSYLVAIRNIDSPQAHLVHVGKVGTGFDSEAHDQIREKVGEENWVDYDRNTKIPHLIPWTPAERPDKIIKDLDKAPLLEVSFAKLYKDDSWPAGYTMRFPRNKRVRLDLNWRDDAATIDDLKNKDQRIEEQFNKADIFESSSVRSFTTTKKPSKRKHDRGGILISKELRKEFDLFSGMSFHLLSAIHYTIQVNNSPISLGNVEIQRIISRFGAKVIFEAKEVNHFYLSDRNSNSLLINQTQEKGQFSILDVEWIFDCIKAKRRLPLTPHYFLAISTRHATALANVYDTVWGLPMDRNDITVEELKAARNSVNAFKSCKITPTNSYLQKEKTNKPSNNFNEIRATFITNCLTDYTFVLNDPQAACLEPRVRYLGGTIIDDPTSANYALVTNKSDYKGSLLPVDSLWLEGKVAEHLDAKRRRLSE
mmetsp:Transcript_13705/g.17110  ORF Transcript_13705/g.17110 Transcript_13705/m.17110 type:complete len:941 (-) Transcript_13705:209-3031(-)